jgi:hypothetical protein
MEVLTSVIQVVKVAKIATFIKNYKLSLIWILFIFSLLFVTFVTLFLKNWDNIPSREDHKSRNKRNVLPLGKLRHIKDNIYIDESGVAWIKRPYYRNLLHNPLKYYTFETAIDATKGTTSKNTSTSTSEASILISDFEKGKMNFEDESYNYYSSFDHPVSHFFADMLPIALYRD